MRYRCGITMKKDNVIFRDANAFNVSDGKTDHAGVEYEFTWPVIVTLTLFASGTYAKHQYAFDRTIEGGETIVSGRDVDTAPRHINTARASWRSPPAQLRSSGNYCHIGLMPSMA
jgi:outer membrane receptor protein involved in Fe transport